MRAWALLLAGLLAASGNAARAEPDSGPVVAIEGSADVDWGPYAKEMKASVRAHWVVPRVAQRGATGAVTLHFSVTPEGHLEDLTMVKRKGPRSLTQAARSALEAAAPYPPPPESDGEEDSLGVTWSFFYNMSAGETKRWANKLKKQARKKAREAAQAP